jgi:hypothetical protein
VPGASVKVAGGQGLAGGHMRQPVYKWLTGNFEGGNRKRQSAVCDVGGSLFDDSDDERPAILRRQQHGAAVARLEIRSND